MHLTIIWALLIGFVYFQSRPIPAEFEIVFPEEKITEQILKKDKPKKVKKEIIKPTKVKSKTLSKRQFQCLVDNVYFEATGESFFGKKAIASVTLNRVKHPRFPNTICDVVYERNKKLCQFSWVCGNKRKYDPKAYNESLAAAKHIVKNHGKTKNITGGALFFHADYVNHVYFKKLIYIKKIGRHLFYGLPT